MRRDYPGLPLDNGTHYRDGADLPKRLSSLQSHDKNRAKAATYPLTLRPNMTSVTLVP
jgi:hypothetical protein